MRKLLVLGFWIGLVGLIVWYLGLIPTFLYPTKKSPLREKIKFGMDLVGGTYLTLEVQTDKAVEAQLQIRAHTIGEVLKSEGKTLPISKDVKDMQIILKFEDPNAANDASLYVKDRLRDMEVKVDANLVKVNFTKMKENEIKKSAVQTNRDVLDNRLNVLSVEEISISRKGEKQIIIELPDIDDPQKARAMIGKPAVLEFKLVERMGPTREDILYEYEGVLPDGMEILPDKNKNREGKPFRFYLVPQFTEITGALLRDAKPRFDEREMQHVVAFTFSSEGGDKFYDLTSRNHERELAIVLDNQVISAPRIHASISTEGRITGGFTAEGAKELSTLLKSGALIAPVTVEEDRQVMATLGYESIRKGLMACVVGLSLLLFFSILYYKVSGALAFVALIFNLLLVLFGLSQIGATLTLPGIAGMILTIGMAIDASILIYERIKEALRSGVSIKQAVNSGFSNAMTVILDANITTLMVALVLYQFGTGPIRGFAVTLMLGIIATLITGLLFLRSLFNLMIDAFKIKKLSI